MNPVAAVAPTRLPPTIAGRELDQIFDAYHQQLYRYCLAILGDPQDAEEALQETMAEVVRALPGETREIGLKPWLYRIAHNESIDLIRRRRPTFVLEESEPEAGTPLAEQVEMRQRLRQLIADVGVLPERQRGALLMREAGGLGFDEIAAALGTTPAVARQTLYEARLGLREMDAGRAMECTAVTEALSAGDGRVRRRRDVRAHLRGCEDCRRFTEEIASRRTTFAAISPLPAVAAVGILRVLGGGGTAASVGGPGATGGTGLGGAAGAATAKSVGAATLLKGAATLAVVTAIGVGSADLGGSHRPAHPVLGRLSPARPVARPDVTRGTGHPTAAGPVGMAAVSRLHSNGRPAPRAEDSAGGRRVPTAAHPISAPVRVALSPPPRTDSLPSPAVSPTLTGAGAIATDPGAGTTAAPGVPAGEHPHGRDHAEQTPEAAAHGQETATDAKAKETPEAGAEAAGPAESPPPEAADAGHPEHPARPVHPAHPVTPSNPEATPPAAAAEEPPQAEAEVEEPETVAEPPGRAKEKKS